jgi:hypothetical protein
LEEAPQVQMWFKALLFVRSGKGVYPALPWLVHLLGRLAGGGLPHQPTSGRVGTAGGWGNRSTLSGATALLATAKEESLGEEVNEEDEVHGGEGVVGPELKRVLLRKGSVGWAATGGRAPNPSHEDQLEDLRNGDERDEGLWEGPRVVGIHQSVHEAVEEHPLLDGRCHVADVQEQPEGRRVVIHVQEREVLAGIALHPNQEGRVEPLVDLGEHKGNVQEPKPLWDLVAKHGLEALLSKNVELTVVEHVQEGRPKANGGVQEQEDVVHLSQSAEGTNIGLGESTHGRPDNVNQQQVGCTGPQAEEQGEWVTQAVEAIVQIVPGVGGLGLLQDQSRVKVFHFFLNDFY